jgi:hypothetical protein
VPRYPIRDLFNKFGNEDTQHRGELEKVYYSVVHSGSVNACRLEPRRHAGDTFALTSLKRRRLTGTVLPSLSAR